MLKEFHLWNCILKREDGNKLDGIDRVPTPSGKSCIFPKISKT